eukprot:CAMPEP_0202452426 /NCGR_PEP_ID=MMETSP1360-20130828/10648_1 /ASSEMBLY_ACC=CAM_ASM_000848 /TAXON_ID=515479 /ORGANISM="Licmophora paradoxa, Strain CCMP2313" /LENGTH=30 /DNA_ID= /DNA_START= /DNA_END= /DNA_ORIENTATION=
MSGEETVTTVMPNTVSPNHHTYAIIKHPNK